MNAILANPTVKRLLACLFGGFVLALMIGDQHGSQNDFGISFHQAVHPTRLLVFLGIGLAIFAALSFRPLLLPYAKAPGTTGIIAGFLAVLAAMVLMNWYDPVGKFGDLATQVGNTNGLDFLSTAFFGWLGYTLWFGCLVVGIAAVVTRNAVLGYVLLVAGAASAVIAFVAHVNVVDFAGGKDHSLGVYAAVVGYVVFAGAGLVVARAKAEVADPRAFVEAVMGWRPGFPLAVFAGVLLPIIFNSASWFAPLQLNLDYAGVKKDFDGIGLSSLAWQFVSWLGLVLSIATVLLALAATYLRHRLLGAVTAVVGFVGLLLTFFTVHAVSDTGSKQAPQYGGMWQNLGAGGWVLCIAFGLLMVSGILAMQRRPVLGRDAEAGIAALPVHQALAKTATSSLTKTLVPVAILLALFYPPTLPVVWQNVIVTQIGVYILLAVGLNVVVGWAGLLDLGYIAFYGIGSYTTAYLVGALPLKPPSFLHLPALWAIPFAILACLIAGVLLGAPTLRLRGDYLAIVTLGFGEIVQIAAINNPFNLTGGPTGPNLSFPRIHIGPLKVTFGLDNLPYWYLLLIFIVVMVILFYRLEGSRLGRAWAAIREDEVAAQATGINTTRVKLLAFAIGASTSGLAGVFFATKVGYFDPSAFSLQNSILIVAYVVFGGMGSLPGAIAGAAVLTWLPQFLKDQVPPADRFMWIGALVTAMMIFRPAGLIPAKRRRAELSGFGDESAAPDSSAVPRSGAM
ncbi:MAG TPA: branched-chain amino acid ABC transporter permease [Jatrophihabitans sp.]|jgi:ABC-type branched-subunit amino acid transport system permease subunit|uniref:branched-chain amino acid ABC transporter permease n=1 Tax=Jatrophihabitans sp. TaxID=1932789 RepID=UPI002E0AA874|nr:branched-chain amino acid ABC transporter permease [Jatrophihabitans sp.]